MIENRFVTTESSFIDMAWWDQCTDATATPVAMNTALPVWVGVDASVKRDSTAIVVVTFDRAAQKVVLVTHRIFQPTVREPLDFERTVEATLRELMKRFAVRGVFYDPYQMAAVAQRLQAVGLPMREFPQTVGGLTEIGSNLYELIKGRGLIVYPDAELRLAISRAIAVETSRGWRIAKEKAAHKVDVVVALAMAAHAAIQGSRVPEFRPVMPVVFGTPRYFPGSDEFTGSGAPVSSSAPAAYDYNREQSWKDFVNADGSIRSTPRGGWGVPMNVIGKECLHYCEVDLSAAFGEVIAAIVKGCPDGF